jgi:hypothetical protein
LTLPQFATLCANHKYWHGEWNMKIREIIEDLDTAARPQTTTAPKAPTTTTPVSAKMAADKTRVDALKTTADAAGDRLKAERERQKQQKAVHTLSSLSKSVS